MLPRQSHPEPQADEDLTDEDRRQIGGSLKRLQSFSGVSGSIYRCIQRIPVTHRPLRVLVIPTPDVEVPLSWAKRSRQSGREIELTLVNVLHNPSTDALISRAIDQDHSVKCIDIDLPSGNIPTGFDIVTSLYLMHRLRDDQIFRLLQSFAYASDGRLVVCDFARSRANALLARSAWRSVHASYSIDEFQQLAQRALSRPVQIHSVFPCHFIMACKEQTICEPVPAFA